MHIDSEALTSAVAITVGMNIRDYDPVYDWAGDNNMGGVELYHEIGQLAALSCQLANTVAACPDFEHEGFPGVYAYEVDEPFGAWLAQQMREGALPTGESDNLLTPQIKLELGRLAAAYFDKAERPIPYTDAIIFELTGYVRQAPGIPTLEETIERMKREVKADIASGRVPAGITCFADTDDYVDVNYYGGFCEDDLCAALRAHFGGQPDEVMPRAMRDFINAAQDAVDAWIRAGGHREG